MVDNSAQFLNNAERIYGGRVEMAAIHLKNQIRQNVSIPSRTVSLKSTKTGQTKKVLGARGSSRSKPGEFPHKDYGAFRASVAHDFNADQLVARVGSPSKVGRHLELGTKKMRPRPWLRRTLKEERETIRQLIVHGSRSDIHVGG